MVNKTHEELAQSGANEDRVIGCALTEASCLDNSPGLTAEHFYSDRNRAIFLSIKRLRESGVPVDAGTVADDLANRGALSDIGGAQYLLDLMELVPQLAHFGDYAKKVIERRERAKLKGKFRQLMDALDSGEDLETVLAEADDLSTEQIGGKRFEFHSARELVEGDFKQEWHIPGWLAKAQTCIIAGPKKNLKTNILLLIAFCLCTANMLFRRFAVSEACNVGIMSGESAPGTIQETFNRIVKSYGWSPQYVDGFHICFKLPSLTNPVDLSEIKRFILDMRDGLIQSHSAKNARAQERQSKEMRSGLLCDWKRRLTTEDTTTRKKPSGRTSRNDMRQKYCPDSLTPQPRKPRLCFVRLMSTSSRTC